MGPGPEPQVWGADRVICPLRGPRSFLDFPSLIQLPLWRETPKWRAWQLDLRIPNSLASFSSSGAVCLFLWMKPQSHPPLPRGLCTVALRTAPSLSLRRADRLLDRGCPPSAWAVTGLLPLQGASVAFCLLKGICVPCPGGASDLAPQRCQVSGWRWARGCGRGRSSGNVRGAGGCCPWPLGRLRLAGREGHCEMEETPLPSCLGFS